MLDSRVYHVWRRPDDTWAVLRDGFKRPHCVRESKDEAVLVAKRLAKTGPGARVIVHTQDHGIEREFTFSTELIETERGS